MTYVTQICVCIMFLRDGTMLEQRGRMAASAHCNVYIFLKSIKIQA